MPTSSQMWLENRPAHCRLQRGVGGALAFDALPAGILELVREEDVGARQQATRGEQQWRARARTRSPAGTGSFPANLLTHEHGGLSKRMALQGATGGVT